mmetsp:Transcript_15545/g.39703  ORF Transcript_15545/g.39703 Transcript_15545/m.39703 type:complete len:229 (+) Transcript_15545:1155-1841(+)
MWLNQVLIIDQLLLNLGNLLPGLASATTLVQLSGHIQNGSQCSLQIRVVRMGFIRVLEIGFEQKRVSRNSLHGHNSQGGHVLIVTALLESGGAFVHKPLESTTILLAIVEHLHGVVHVVHVLSVDTQIGCDLEKHLSQAGGPRIVVGHLFLKGGQNSGVGVEDHLEIQKDVVKLLFCAVGGLVCPTTGLVGSMKRPQVTFHNRPNMSNIIHFGLKDLLGKFGTLSSIF